MSLAQRVGEFPATKHYPYHVHVAHCHHYHHYHHYHRHHHTALQHASLHRAPLHRAPLHHTHVNVHQPQHTTDPKGNIATHSRSRGRNLASFVLDALDKNQQNQGLHAEPKRGNKGKKSKRRGVTLSMGMAHASG